MQKTEAKLLWDKKFLYVAVDNADSDMWAKLTKRDDKLWTEEADEIMIDADGNGRTYVELQVAPNGNVFDTYLPEHRKYEDTDESEAEAVRVELEDERQGARRRHAEQARGPGQGLDRRAGDSARGRQGDGRQVGGARCRPTPGDVWRINMFRMDVPQGKPQQAAGWSPPMVGDFHALDRFGELVFADAQGNVPPPAPSPLAKVVAKGGPARIAPLGSARVLAPTPDRKAAAAEKNPGAGKKN